MVGQRKLHGAENLLRLVKSVSRTTERSVLVASPQGSYPLRLIAFPWPACKKGKPVSQATWRAAGLVLRVTHLPAAPR